MSTYVLIHGAADTSFHWHLIEPLLRDRGHDVVTMDLPAADPTAGLPRYVGTVLAAVGDRRDLIVVGHSLGAFTAGQIPKYCPVSQLVYVNGMIPTPGETAGEWWDNTGHDVDDSDVVATYMQLTPPEVVAAAQEHAAEGEAGAMKDPFPGDVPRVRTRALQAADDRFFEKTWMLPIVRHRLGIEPVVLPGDHCVALSNPVDLVDVLTGWT